MDEHVRRLREGMDAATATARLRHYRRLARRAGLVESYAAEWNARGIFAELLRMRVDRYADRSEAMGEVLRRSEKTLDWEPAEVKQRLLAGAEWQRFAEEVAAAKLWQLPTRDESTPGLDGEVWTIEGFLGGRFHFVRRHSWSVVDGTGAEVFRFGHCMARLAGLTRFEDAET
jgi:hypothetical protein